MRENLMQLAEGFAPASREQWLALVDKVLRGRDFERTLVSRTADGLPIAPLYTRDDLSSAATGEPGRFPFIRGARLTGVARGWDIRQLCAAPWLDDARRAIGEELQHGSTSIEIRIDRRRHSDDDMPDGVCLAGKNDLAQLLAAVPAESATLAFDPGPLFAQIGQIVRETSSIGHALNADPLGAVAVGELAPGDGMAEALALARTANKGSTTLRADGEPYHAAGASDAQELAATVATGIAYLRGLTEAGMDVDAAAAQIRFRLAADADMFASIAKCRAARLLWANVIGHSGGTLPMALEAITAGRMMTRRDPWVNMLRTTTAALAAGLGGAEAITVLPFDWELGQPDAFSRRIARNIQLILMQESNLHQVADPAGGSFHVEHLTRQVALKAWALVQQIEAEGGMLAALEGGTLQDRIAETYMERLARIARVEDAITGVSTFPFLDEKLPMPIAVDLARLPAPWATRTLAPIVAPLRPMRLAEAFERLRDVGDEHLARHGQRPRVFLATLGTPAEHGPRAAFARNLFAAGGIEAIVGPPAELAWTSCRLACLCGTDEAYSASAGVTVAALKHDGAEAIYLAGRPNDSLRAAGVDSFIHLGCNALSLLEDAHSLLLGDRP